MTKSKVYLLDSNVLIALATPEHSLNARAAAWFLKGLPVCNMPHHGGRTFPFPPAHRCGGDGGIRKVPARVHCLSPAARVLAGRCFLSRHANHRNRRAPTGHRRLPCAFGAEARRFSSHYGPGAGFRSRWNHAPRVDPFCSANRHGASGSRTCLNPLESRLDRQRRAGHEGSKRVHDGEASHSTASSNRGVRSHPAGRYQMPAGRQSAHRCISRRGTDDCAASGALPDIKFRYNVANEENLRPRASHPHFRICARSRGGRSYCDRTPRRTGRGVTPHYRSVVHARRQESAHLRVFAGSMGLHAASRRQREDPRRRSRSLSAAYLDTSYIAKF